MVRYFFSVIARTNPQVLISAEGHCRRVAGAGIRCDFLSSNCCEFRCTVPLIKKRTSEFDRNFSIIVRYANAIFSQVGSLEDWENCRSRNLAEVKVTTAVHGMRATARNIGCDRFLGRIRSRSRHFRERPRLVRAAVWFLSVDGRRPLSRRAKGENGVGQNYT